MNVCQSSAQVELYIYFVYPLLHIFYFKVFLIVYLSRPMPFPLHSGVLTLLGIFVSNCSRTPRFFYQAISFVLLLFQPWSSPPGGRVLKVKGKGKSNGMTWKRWR